MRKYALITQFYTWPAGALCQFQCDGDAHSKLHPSLLTTFLQSLAQATRSTVSYYNGLRSQNLNIANPDANKSFKSLKLVGEKTGLFSIQRTKVLRPTQNGSDRDWKHFHMMDHSGGAGCCGGGHAEKSESLCQSDSTSKSEEGCHGMFCPLKGCQRILEHNAAHFLLETCQNCLTSY